MSVDDARSRTASFNEMLQQEARNIALAVDFSREAVPELFPELFDRATGDDVERAVGVLLFEQRPINLVDGRHVFNLIDEEGSDALTIQDLMHGVEKDEVKQFILAQGDSPLLSLLDRDQMSATFAYMDTDHDERLSKVEWARVLHELTTQHFNYIRVRSHLEKRAFWGKGIVATTAERPPEDEAALFWSSWKADFWHYECNHHPFFGICYHEAVPAASGAQALT